MRAQITARFGDSLVELVELDRGGSFRVGTAPGVDLAIAQIGSFPIASSDATGFVVRTPVGLGDGPSELRLAPGVTATLRCDQVSITAELITRAVVMPRAKLDRRMVPFLVGSLIAHLDKTTFQDVIVQRSAALANCVGAESWRSSNQ